MSPPREPSWWYEPRMTWQARILQPAAAVYGQIAERNAARATAYVSRLPVICVGNLTAGGTGKTPIAMLIARLLQKLGEKPVFLSRGYGGRIDRPVWVHAEQSRADEVGDEPLLLARTAPALVSRDRAAGARAIEASDASVVVMDDGMQNPGLKKDFVLAVVDSKRGFGNGAVIPAGPLRAPLPSQLKLADAIVVNGGGRDGSRAVEALKREYTGPVLASEVCAQNANEFQDKRVIAYAGIANPQRFFDTLRLTGADVVMTQMFNDHHVFTAADAERLLDLQSRHAADLVTTGKDWVRMQADAAAARLQAASQVLKIEAVMRNGDEERLAALLAAALEKRRGKI